MTDARKPRTPPRPLDAPRLQELAVHYVGRFATTRAKLATYLRRKLRERGWEGTRPPDIEALAERLAGLGYIDDEAFAMAKARSLGLRGYGGRRVGEALRQAGVSEDDGAGAIAVAAEGAVAAAVRYAQRRRIGPFAREVAEPKARDRALSAMLRAGHSFALARRILDLAPAAGTDPDTLVRRLESLD